MEPLGLGLETENLENLGLSLGEPSLPMGGMVKPAPVYKPKTVAPISPLLGKTLSETVQGFIGEKTFGDPSSNKAYILEALGKKMVELLKESAERRPQRDDAIKQMKEAIELTVPNRESPLGEDGANIRTPLTYKIYNALHAFYLEASTGIRPYLKTEPMYGGDITVANKIEAYYDGLYEEQIRFVKKMDTAISMCLQDGTVFLRPCWAKSVRMMHATDKINAQNAALFGLTVEDGTYTDGKESYRDGDIFSGLREVVEKDCPDLEVISYFDVFLSPADVSCVDKATIVGERFFTTIDALRHDARAGLLDSKQLRDMEDSKSLLPIDDMHQTNLLLSARLTSDSAIDDGIESDMKETILYGKSTQRTVECFKGIVRFDGDGDELDEDWLVTLELSTGIILSAQHYSGNGLVPYRPMVVFDRPGKLYGMPLPQVLDGMQNESDTAVNLIIDAAMLANTVIVEESEGNRSPLDTSDLHVGLNKFAVSEAGKGYKVHQLVTGVQADIFPARETIEVMASEATAASETLIGSVASRSGTTAYETNQALVAGARRLKVGVNRIRECVWSAQCVLHFLCVLNYALKSGGDPAYKIPYPMRQGAKTEYMEMTLADFISPVRFFLLGDGINTDKALQLQAAEKLYLMAERSPFIMGKMERLYAITADFLSAYGKKDYLNFIGTIEEAREMDAEAEKAAKDPKNSIPELLPTARPEYVASVLAKADPEAVGTYFEILQALYQAQASKSETQSDAELEAAKLETEQVKAEADIDKTLMETKHKLEIGKYEIEKVLGEAKNNAQAQATKFAADQQVSQAKQDAQMKVAQARSASQKARTGAKPVSRAK